MSEYRVPGLVRPSGRETKCDRPDLYFERNAGQASAAFFDASNHNPLGQVSHCGISIAFVPFPERSVTEGERVSCEMNGPRQATRVHDVAYGQVNFKIGH